MKKIILFAILLNALSVSLPAQSVLINFHGTVSRYGDTPEGDLFSDGTFLYGMTYFGGINDKGVIFKVKPDGTAYDTVMSFNLTNGRFPAGGLISDGTFLYGMTKAGGVNDAGIVFKVKPDGTGYADLHDFDLSTDGNTPVASLVSDGTFLYGMTFGGGAFNAGIIFKIMPDGTGYSIIHDFPLTGSGIASNGSLIFDGTYLYGLTPNGGISNNGGVFRIKPDGTGFTHIYNSNTADGNHPRGSLISDGTYLYGMAYGGGALGYGTIFKVKPDGTGYSVLHSFASGSDGKFPFASLAFGGNYLYGMTQYGGTSNEGTIFKVKKDGTGYLKLRDLVPSTSSGSKPGGSFISDGTFLYATSTEGGSYSKGTVFQYQYTQYCSGLYSTVYDSTLNNFTLTVNDTSTVDLASGYFWDFGDGTTSTLANPSHTYTVDTVYNVCMRIYRSESGDSCTYCDSIGKDYLGNIIRSSGFTINVYNPNVTTGISQHADEPGISVYPNPSGGIFIVHGNSIAKIEIYNLLGDLIYSGSGFKQEASAEINISNHPEGIYFMRIYDGVNAYTRKVILR
ncbi:MAG: hypothetical protein JWO44_671 [Bacteroidetes bacterium]|nr:hypothetical protein [Bacteroidota bacterium]